MSAAAKKTKASETIDAKQASESAPRLRAARSWYTAEQWLSFAALMADHVDELEVEIAVVDEFLISGQRDSIDNMRELASKLRELVADVRMQAQKGRP